MDSHPSRRFGLVLALVLVGCAPRGLPPRFPEESVASREAAPAATSRVTLALDEDPPLPGEDAEGWEGLGEARTSEEHSRHEGHR